MNQTVPTHALSVRQPWAWAMIRPDVTDPTERSSLVDRGLMKEVENRDWPTQVRGRVFVHAAKAWGKQERETLQYVRTRWPKLPWPESYDLGGIVGSVDITDCVRENFSKWFFGPYGFAVRDSMPLPFTPLRGSLGFFRVPHEVRANILFTT